MLSIVLVYVLHKIHRANLFRKLGCISEVTEKIKHDSWVELQRRAVL